MHISSEQCGFRWWADLLPDGEFYLGPAFGLSWRCGDENGWLFLGLLFFSLHIQTRVPRFVREMSFDQRINGTQYGFNFVGGSGIHIHWGADDGTHKGSRYAIWRWPWTWWYHYSTEKISLEVTVDYRYELSSGEVQERKATFHAERMEWRWHLFNTREWRTPIRRVAKSIDVSFDDEVGDRTGSWKGGTVGCGYTMNPGERPIDTLRRMERERSFR